VTNEDEEFLRMAEECGIKRYLYRKESTQMNCTESKLIALCKKVQDKQMEKDQAKIAAKNAALTMAYKSMYLVKHSFGHQFPLNEVKDALNK
jgi:hypothetical protein